MKKKEEKKEKKKTMEKVEKVLLCPEVPTKSTRTMYVDTLGSSFPVLSARKKIDKKLSELSAMLVE